MSTTTQEKAYVEKEYGWMVGKTIEQVRVLTSTEIDDLGWYPGGTTPLVVFFTDGTYIIPMQDEEGNGPGALLHPER
jgi:hypothetical protein